MINFTILIEYPVAMTYLKTIARQFERGFKGSLEFSYSVVPNNVPLLVICQHAKHLIQFVFYRDVPQISEKLAKMTFKMILVFIFWLLTLVRSFDFNHHQGPTPFETFLLPLNYIIRSESSLKHLNCLLHLNKDVFVIKLLLNYLLKYLKYLL